MPYKPKQHQLIPGVSRSVSFKWPLHPEEVTHSSGWAEAPNSPLEGKGKKPRIEVRWFVSRRDLIVAAPDLLRCLPQASLHGCRPYRGP